MPNELPPSVRVGYRDYAVEHIPVEDMGKTVGWHYPQKHIIQIDFTNLNQTEIVNTYLHEVFHAMFSLVPDQFETEDQEEAVVSYLGNAMSQFLKDNPDTISWMLKALNAKQL